MSAKTILVLLNFT